MKKFILLLLLWGVLIVFNDGERLFLPNGSYYHLKMEGWFSGGYNYVICSDYNTIIADIPFDKVKYIILQEHYETKQDSQK